MFSTANLLKFTGGAFIAYHTVYRPMMGVYRHFIRTPFDLASRYGQHTWVVITGGSDGIGKGYAKEFAKRGFNLYLIARTEDKLKDVCQELQNEYKVEARYLSKDFTHSYEHDFFDDIFEQTKDLDVSVLINNVGMVNMKTLPDAKREDVHNVITTNTYSQAMLSQEFLRRMKNRERKSAIISLSSFSGGKPVSVCPIYTATKGYNDFLSRALRHEFKEKVDISKLSYPNSF